MFSRPVSSRMEAGTELEQRRQATPRDDLAHRGLQDPGDALQQRRLARAVVSEEADRLALRDLEVGVTERPEVLVRDPAEVDGAFLQRRVPLVVEAEALGDGADLDRGSHVSELLGEVRFQSTEHRDSDREDDDSEAER